MGDVNSKPLLRYGFAILVLCAAIALRLLLDPILNQRLPFITLFAAVTVAVWYGGRGPASLVLLAGLMAVTYFVLEPRRSIVIEHREDVIGLVFYAVISIGCIALVEQLRGARGRAEQKSAEALQQYEQLQREVLSRVRAEAVAAQERERLRVTLASIGDGVITTDAQGQVTFLNDVAQDLTGWTTQAAEGLPLQDVFRIINEFSRQSVASPVERALRDGVIVGLANHTILISKNGSERPIDDSAAPIRDPEGNIIGVVLIFRDVTQQRRSEQAVRVSEARKSAILETALDCVITMDHDGHVVEFNPAAERTFGYRRSEVIGRELASLIIPPELRERHRSGMADYLRTGKGPVLGKRLELPAVRADGTQFPVELAITRISTDGPPLFTAYLRDITDRKQREQHRNIRFAVTQALAQAVSLQQGANNLLQAVCENLQWAAGFFWSIDPEDSLLHCRSCWIRADVVAAEFEAASYSCRFKRGEGLPGRVWGHGQATWIGDFSAESHLPRASFAAKVGFRSAFAYPVVAGETVAGVVEFFAQDRRESDPELLELMSSVAADFGHFIRRRQTEERLQEQTRIAETLNEIGMILAAEMEHDKIVQAVTDQGTKLTAAEFGAFFYNVLDDRGGSYMLYALSGVPREAFAKFPMPRNTAIFSPTFLGEGVVRLADVTQDPRFGQNPPYHGMPKGHLPVRSYLAVPVISRSGEVLGGLFFGHSQTGVFTARHEQIMCGVAAQAAIAIDNARLYQRTQESEERFRQLAEHVHDVFWMSDPNKQEILYISPAYERLWGRTRQSLYDQPRSFLDAIHVEDRERVEETLRRQTAGEATSLEYRVVRPDGSVRWVWDRAFPICDAAGQLYRVAGIAEDIDTRKRAEQASHFLAEASATLATVVDYESTLQKVAGLAVPTFADWCAVDLAEPDGSLRRLAVVHSDEAKVRLATKLHQDYPPSRDAAYGAYHVLHTGEPEYMEEITDNVLQQLAEDEAHLEIIRKLGLRSYICVPLQTRKQTLGILTFVYAESGRCYGADDLALASELARRAAIAIENAGLYHELKEADRRKDEFLATLAHELRNPLAPLRNGLQVMQLAGADGEIVAETRLMMERQLNQMVRLVDDLLDVSRITRNKLELRKQPVDLAAVVHSAVETSRPVIEEAEHHLEVQLPESPVSIEADSTRLAQVFSNLLNNSAKYTPRGGHICLSINREGRDVIVQVRDDGIGIPAESLPKLFQMFSQVDHHLERAQGGLGIGLTLVRRLVEMHGGTVEATSAGPGRGSEFTVRLPMLFESAPGRLSSPATEREPTSGQRHRILVVDDNRDSALSLAMMLRLTGNDVRTAHDGLEAVDVAEDFRPDTILLDIGLPKLNGYEACRRIRRQPWSAATVIVALTGWGQEEDRRRSAEAGFNHHLVKPVERAALEAILSSPEPS